MTPTMTLLLQILMVGQFTHLYHEESEEVTVYNDVGKVTVKQNVFQQVMNAISDQSSWESHGMPFALASELDLF